MSIREAMQSGAARSSDSTPGVAPGLGRGFQRRGWLPRPASVGSLLYEWQQSGHGSRAGAPGVARRFATRLAHPRLLSGKPTGLSRAHAGAALGDALSLCRRLWPGSGLTAGVSAAGYPRVARWCYSSLPLGGLFCMYRAADPGDGQLVRACVPPL